MEQVNKSLYALNKDGSYQQWDIWVDGADVIVLFGKLDGKIQRKVTTCQPKNVGRSNETTAEEQAVLEAQSKWEKQYRLGYRETTEELQTEEILSPMLAQDALKKKHQLTYPAHTQPKLDGLRCLVTFDENGDPVFNSRGNKTYPIQGKIVEELKGLRDEMGISVFDGEVYIHGLSLQKIVSLAKKWRSKASIEDEINKEYLTELKKWKKDPSIHASPEPDTNKYGGYSSDDLEFHIFDIPTKNKVWYDGSENCRWYDLMCVSEVVSWVKYDKLKVVSNQVVNNEEEALLSVAKNMQAGYEGSIIRNFKGEYEFGQRSTDLQKWKEFQTIEAKVLSVSLDKNDEGVLNCILKSGVTFSCKMKGNHQYRSYKNMLTLIEKFITISFQAYTEDGVPQFPVGISERDVNQNTWEVLE